MLYLIGLGLGNEKDITVCAPSQLMQILWCRCCPCRSLAHLPPPQVKGLEAVRKCAKVYLEHYTSVLGVDTAKLVC